MISNKCDWIEWVWTKEKPYPEALETLVYVKFRDYYVSTDTVEWWHDPNVKYSSWHQTGDVEDIVAYRVVN